MKKILILLVALVFILGGCSSTSTSTDTAKETTAAPSGKVLSKADFEKMYSNPNDYKGARRK
ncbi:hypothetical protein [Tepidibacillus marianensis]|uniref:hypothetical protein n=1 Tax=Tepidibacillus marianensis TaxID=3131995 RepID=UPI0030D1F57D